MIWEAEIENKGQQIEKLKENVYKLEQKNEQKKDWLNWGGENEEKEE